MCSGSEAGSYVRLIDLVCHSTLGLRVKKKEEIKDRAAVLEGLLERESYVLTTYWSEST